MAFTMRATYTYGRRFRAATFEQALSVTKDAFLNNKWGLPPGTTDIDFHKVFEAKNVDKSFRPMHLFGFCNPQTAHSVLQNEPSAAVFLPCNVAVAEIEPGVYECAAISPAKMFLSMDMKGGEMQGFVDEADQNIIAALDALPKDSELSDFAWNA